MERGGERQTNRQTDRQTKTDRQTETERGKVLRKKSICPQYFVILKRSEYSQQITPWQIQNTAKSECTNTNRLYERERDRQTDRDRDRDRETERDRDRDTERVTERDREREFLELIVG